MQQANKRETRELYVDSGAQMLVSKFLSGEIKTLEPIYDQQVGYRYPVVETMVEDASQVEPFLSKLHSAGILERRLYDKTIFCPNCGSAAVSFHYCCPFCKSFDIRKSSLIEHVKCGYMDVEESFRKGDKYVCPKCHLELKKVDVDYRRAGVWCTCKDCTKSFDIPVPEHFCRNCNAISSFEEAVIRDVYSYTLKESVREEASASWFLIAPIRNFLIEEGLKVESPAFLKGKSGTNHSFDILASRADAPQKPIVIDLAKATADIVSEQPVIALFAKIFDVSPDKAYLIAIPRLSENAKKMADLYHIDTVEAENPEEAVRAFKEEFK